MCLRACRTFPFRSVPTELRPAEETVSRKSFDHLWRLERSWNLVEPVAR